MNLCSTKRHYSHQIWILKVIFPTVNHNTVRIRTAAFILIHNYSHQQQLTNKQ